MLNHLGQVAQQAAQKFGDKEALLFNGQSFTFAELADMIERVAAGLVAAGVKHGDVVTLYADNSWKWIVSYYAIARAGAVINPVNTMLTPEEIRYVVDDCGAKVIIASEDKVAGANAVLDRVLAAFTFGEDAPDGMGTFDQLLNGGAPVIPEIDVHPEDLSTICYTSGTTGHPKGAMQSHRSVILNATLTAQTQNRGASDIMISALPCPHVYATVIMQVMMLYGAKLVLHERFDPKAVLEDAERQKATLIDGVPTMYMYLLNEPDLDSTDLSSLTRAFVGGQTMPVATMETVEKNFGVPLTELWGMTEIAGLGSTHPHDGDVKYGSIGCALPDCELRIADPEDPDGALPRQEVGELQVKGPITMMGYFGAERKTKETLLESGWLRTGDLGHMDEDGYVFIVDRLKDMILTGGFNVYPAEIERVLAEHPDIVLAAVGRKKDEVKGEVAKAYVVLKEGATADKEAINAFCRERLSAYKCPRSIQFVSDLPTTSTGKIMRRELHTLDKASTSR